MCPWHGNYESPRERNLRLAAEAFLWALWEYRADIRHYSKKPDTLPSALPSTHVARCDLEKLLSGYYDLADAPPAPDLLALIKDADTPTAEEAAEAEIDRGLSERSWEQFKKMSGWKNQQQVRDPKTGEFILVDPP